jgi:hypothetical protein
MTAAQQAYADQEDQLRLLGFLSELGGDMALGQIFYHIAYGITPPLPPSALDSAGGGSDLSPPFITPSPPSITPSGLVTGASDVGDTGADLTLTTPVNTGVGPATAVPEASTWVMMAIGFLGFGFMGRRVGSRRTAGQAAKGRPKSRPLALLGSPTGLRRPQSSVDAGNADLKLHR